MKNATLFERRLYLILCIAAAILALVCRGLSGAQFGAFFFFCLAVGLLVMTVLSNLKAGRIAKWALMGGRIVFIGWIITFALAECIIWLGSGTDEGAYNSDYYIVLGAGLNGDRPSLSLVSRLEAAYRALEHNPEAKAVLSGGFGQDSTISEAEAMTRWLSSRGIEKDRLLLEDKARNTIENISNSKRIIENIRGGEDYTVTVVTNEFHLMRGKLLAKGEGMETFGLSADTPFAYLRVVYSIREYFSVMGLLLTGRII